MQYPNLIFLILILNLLKADGFDTLTYYDKFDVAVQTYKEQRYRLSEKYFSFFKNMFFDRKKKLRKFSTHYIDVEFSEEFIFRIFRAV